MNRKRPFVATVLFLVLGCTNRAGPPTTQPSLRSPDGFHEDFFLRQEILARHEGRSVMFQAALEKKKSLLRLVGLTPYGSPAFMIEQAGSEFRFEEYVPLDIPFAPMSMLVDVHRVLFEGSGMRPGLSDGTHEFEAATGSVIETWENGNIATRVFVDTDSVTELSRIEFQGDRDAAPITAPLVILRDRTHGYELEIRTVEQRLFVSAPREKSAAGN